MHDTELWQVYADNGQPIDPRMETPSPDLCGDTNGEDGGKKRRAREIAPIQVERAQPQVLDRAHRREKQTHSAVTHGQARQAR